MSGNEAAPLPLPPMPAPSALTSPTMLREEIEYLRAAYEACRRPKAAARLREQLREMEARLVTLTNS